MSRWHAAFFEKFNGWSEKRVPLGDTGSPIFGFQKTFP
jgi:hypothetical protein